MINFDHVLERIGAWKKYQVFHYIVLGVAGIPVGMHALANVFLVGDPEFWCDNPVGAGLPESQPTLYTGSSPLSIASSNNTDQYVVHSSQCKIELFTSETNRSDFSAILDPVQSDSCTRWTYDKELYGDTTTAQWDLVCGRSWLKALAQSIYMFGFLVGAIGFGSLSDRIGRKLTWMIALIFFIVSGVAAAFVNNYWIHVWLRFLSGVTSGGAFTCAFVLEMEIIGVEKRMTPGIFYQGWFAVGYMLLGFMAHFIRDYFTLQLVISLIPVLFLGNYWLISESPRWLITQARYKDAADVIQRAARMNNADYPHDLVGDAMNGSTESSTPNEPVQTYSFFHLFKTPRMRWRSANVFFNWFVNSMVYYGLTLSSSDLAGTPYVNMVLSGLAEFVGFFLCIFTVDRFGRRMPLAALLVGGGVACLITLLVPKHLWILETTFAMVGKMSISGSFALIYVFSAELFPTVVRTIGVGAGSMHARIGSLVAPFIGELGKVVWGPLPIIIFGTSAVVAGALSLFLPETLHQGLPETMEDGEYFGKDQNLSVFGIPLQKKTKIPADDRNGYDA